MKSVELFYLLLAVVHPLSEVYGRTSLRKFLNRDYYEPPQEDFPVTKAWGILGSLLVMAVLVLPPFVPILWWLALGLILADLYQHAFHTVSRPRKLAPWVHLITIVGVLVSLLWAAGDVYRETVTTGRLALLPIGASIIFGNWAKNSMRVKKRNLGPPVLPAAPPVH